jgi:hypothetical protein
MIDINNYKNNNIKEKIIDGINWLFIFSNV